jgi:MSHA biogenesis protein MshP
MCHDLFNAGPDVMRGMMKHMRKALRHQRGIGVPAALFVITILALLAVAINELVYQNAETFQEEVLLTRAFYAAESGAGFALNALFPPEEFPRYQSDPANNAICDAGPREYTLTAEGLNGCSISVSCALDAEVDDVEYYSITSVGTCENVSRTVQVRTSFEK